MNQGNSAADEEEELPFALRNDRNEEVTVSRGLGLGLGLGLTELTSSTKSTPPIPFVTLLERSSLYSSSTTTIAPPGLASSVVSSPTDGESQASSFYNSHHHNQSSSCSLVHPSSQFLDAAASLLHPSSSLLHSISIPLSNSHVSSSANTTPQSTISLSSYLSSSAAAAPSPSASPAATATAPSPITSPCHTPHLQQSTSTANVENDGYDGYDDGFSMLLQAADDRQQLLPQASITNRGTTHQKIVRLPALPEEDLQSLASQSTTTNHSRRDRQQQQQQQQQPDCDQDHGLNDWFPHTYCQPFILAFGGGQQHQPAQPAPEPEPSLHDDEDEHLMSVSRTILPAATTTTIATTGVGALAAATAPFLTLFRNDERRLASLAGATATRTGENSFRVSLDLSTSSTTQKGVQDVMTVVGNPELLRLWCDAIPNLIITRSSEGVAMAAAAAMASASASAATASDQQQQQSPIHRRRDNEYYEGEWIEATTPPLIPPPHTSCFYSTSRIVSEALGFPSYGKVVMFVERQRGQVSLTIGSFPGNIEMVCQIRVEQQGEGRIRIVNDVRLQRDDPAAAAMTTTTRTTTAGTTTSQSSSLCVVVPMCGMWDLLERCLLPTVDDYMDQVLSSTARLRFLVENHNNDNNHHQRNGENASAFSSSSSSFYSVMMQNSSINNNNNRIRETGSFQEDSLRTPLL